MLMPLALGTFATAPGAPLAASRCRETWPVDPWTPVPNQTPLPSTSGDEKLSTSEVLTEAVELADDAAQSFLLPVSLSGISTCSTVPPSVHAASSTAGATANELAGVVKSQEL